MENLNCSVVGNLFSNGLYWNIDYKVKGYCNRWSVIDEFGDYLLLENNTYGDDTCFLVVKKNAYIVDKCYANKNGEKIILPTIMEIVCETFDDLETALKDECLID